MASSQLTIDVKNMPELIHALLVRMSNLLREEAESESDPRVARKLLEIAARFEAGQ